MKIFFEFCTLELFVFIVYEFFVSARANKGMVLPSVGVDGFPSVN
jgi:hypothetical protein